MGHPFLGLESLKDVWFCFGFDLLVADVVVGWLLSIFRLLKLGIAYVALAGLVLTL